MKKIPRKQIPETARIMAECFADYPLYDVFFPDNPHRLQAITCFFWYRVYTRRDFTYITENGDLLVSYQKPGQKLRSPVGLLLNPVFLFQFFRYVPLKALKKVSQYSAMEREEQKKYYHPEEDWYLQVICTLKEARGNGTFLRVCKELDEGASLYCETHTRRNVRLYRLMGMELCSETQWNGVTHYVLRREKKA